MAPSGRMAAQQLVHTRFVAGDTVRLVFDSIRRELRVYCIKPAGGMQGLGEDSPIATIRRLVPTRMYGAPYATPPLHAIVHLTDVAVPNVAASASAVVEVLNWRSVVTGRGIRPK